MFHLLICIYFYAFCANLLFHINLFMIGIFFINRLYKRKTQNIVELKIFCSFVTYYLHNMFMHNGKSNVFNKIINENYKIICCSTNNALPGLSTVPHLRAMHF